MEEQYEYEIWIKNTSIDKGERLEITISSGLGIKIPNFIYKSVNKSVNQHFSQPINQWFNQSLKNPTCLLVICMSICLFIKMHCWFIRWSNIHSSNQPINQSALPIFVFRRFCGASVTTPPFWPGQASLLVPWPLTAAWDPNRWGLPTFTLSHWNYGAFGHAALCS